MEIALWIILAIVTFFVGYRVGFRHGRAEGWEAGHRTPRMIPLEPESAVPFDCAPKPKRQP